MSREHEPQASAERLEPLAELARAAATIDLPRAGGMTGWTALEATFRRRARLRRIQTLVAGAAITVVAIAGGRHLLSPRAAAPLTYAVEGAAGARSGYIPRVQTDGARVRFSDGTDVVLTRGSRAWVASTSAHGAVLRLEGGQARLSVVHRPDARWSVEAGPFVVEVTGTEFEVEWSGRLRVTLWKGGVVVRGPLTDDGVRLTPGQQLEVHPDDGSLRIDPIAQAKPATAPEDPEAPAAPEETPAPAEETSRPASSARPARNVRPRLARAAIDPAPAAVEIGADWRMRIAQADFAAILRDAEQRGIDTCLHALPSDRLSTLADAARYGGRPELARRILLAQRTRFAGSAGAEEAAFLLGRLAEDTHQLPSTALRWYALYLAEAQSGTYAADARGRQMLLYAKAADRQRAREAARDYLEHHGRGTYAVEARAILEALP